MKTLKTLALLTLMTIVLAACGTPGVGGGRPDPTPAPPAEAIEMPLTGELNDYEGPRALFYVQGTNINYAHNVGWVEADGTFTIDLPEPTDAELTRFADSDKWDASWVDSNVRYVEIAGASGPTSSRMGTDGGRILLHNNGNLQADLMYVDRDTRIQYTQPGFMYIDINLVKGWNVIVLESVRNANGTLLYDWRNATLDEIDWHYSAHY